MSFRERLKEWRESQGLTQTDLANRLGASLRSLTRWESGEGLPNGEALFALAELGCDPTWLLTGRNSSGAKDSGQLGEPHSSAVTAIDAELLADIAKMLEQWLERHKRRMEPAQRGRFLAEAYAFCIEEMAASHKPAAEIAPRIVERFLRVVA
ncbi:helix-turn-helix transcriptional regulator [Azorhizobium sp. AG788]|uniref:helix-turn-helix domain-containing protein n=1 Tax=Azorhizobium sp. AG788 TaxID=2183897 RepID=UPI003138F164